jgi:hypothetical protein
MPVNPQDLFAYAVDCVGNKSVLQRIGHSAKLHSVRSAVSSKGSAASKFGALVGAGFRATVNAIPIPVVGGIVGAIEQKVEKAIKSQLHKRNLKKATDTADKVKFTLKELSVEELDRYRWKVSDSIQEFNKLALAFGDNLAKKRDAKATCEAYLDLAMAMAQVDRRNKKLREACLGICAALKVTVDWIGECESGPGAGTLTISGGTTPGGPPTAGVNKAIAEVKETLGRTIRAEVDAVEQLTTTAQDEHVANYHGKCEKWCCFRRPQGVPDTWANCKDNAAKVLRHLADPFVPDSFNNNLGVLWKTDN